MQFRTLPVLLALFALLVLAADARPWRGMREIMKKRLSPEDRDLSNAERLARGLPLRAPSLKRVAAAHAGPSASPSPSPSRVSHSHKASPTPSKTVVRRAGSPSPSASPGPSVFSGRVAVAKDTKVIGFLNNTATGLGSVDIDGAEGTDIEVKLAVTAAKNPVSLLITNALFSGAPFLGGSSNATLSSDSSAAVDITDVPQTRSDARPTASGASAIWLYNKQSKELSAQWRNLDGTRVNATLAFDAAANFVFLTGNLTAYNAAANATAEAVGFFLSK